MTVYAWKFVVPPDKWRELPGTPMQFKGCVTVVLATTEERARERAREYAAEHGLDSRWLEVADVKRIIPCPGGVLTWVEQ